MLGKLIKHELKNSYIEFSIIYGIFILTSILLGIAMKIDSIVLIVMMAFPLIVLIFVLMALLINNIIKSFNKKFFTNEGYLTFSLPVTIDQLLFSKYLVSVIWIAITYIVLMLSLILMVLIGGAEYISDIGVFDVISLNSLLTLTYQFVLVLIEIIFFITILLLILIILNIGKIKKRKTLIGILLFYAGSIIFSILVNNVVIIPYNLIPTNNGFILMRISDEFFIDTSNSMYSLNNLLYTVLFTVGSIFLIRYLFKNKLELE